MRNSRLDMFRFSKGGTRSSGDLKEICWRSVITSNSTSLDSISRKLDGFLIKIQYKHVSSIKKIRILFLGDSVPKTQST